MVGNPSFKMLQGGRGLLTGRQLGFVGAVPTYINRLANFAVVSMFLIVFLQQSKHVF